MNPLKAIIFALWTSLCFSTGVVADETTPLTLGVYTSDKPSTMYAKFKPIVSYLESHLSEYLGTKVQLKLRLFKNYEDAQQALVSNHVDFVRFGPASYVLAKQKNPGIRLLAVEERQGQLKFQGAIFTTKNSPIRHLSDLQGKSVAFGHKNSTIGRYLAQQALLNAGLSSADLNSFAYLGRHDKVVQSVALEKFSAGSAKHSSINQVNGLRIIRSFDNPSKPWIANSTMDAPVFVAIQKALTQLNNPQILHALCKTCTGFSLVNDQFFHSTRQAITASKLFSKTRP